MSRRGNSGIIDSVSKPTELGASGIFFTFEQNLLVKDRKWPPAGTFNSNYLVIAGGGGGGGSSAGGGEGKNSGGGGSGVVIIKIPDTRTASFSNNVVATLSTAVAGYNIYTVTETTTTNETVTFS